MNSAAIQEIAYDKDEKSLYIVFCNGAEYEYSDVPSSALVQLSLGQGVCETNGKSQCGSWFVGKSPSVGAAFHAYIKDKFPYRRVR